MELRKEIEKNFSKIEKFFSENTLLEFSKVLPECLEKYNIGLGTIIRLKLLRPQSMLYRKFIQNGFTDKEEMTMKVIKEFHNYMRNKI